MSEHPIYDEFWKSRSDLVEADKQPRTVVFSSQGWMEAMKEAFHNASWITHGPSATYCGLHRSIDRDTDAPKIVVTHLTQAEYYYEKRQRPLAVKVSFDPSNPDGLPQMEVLGRALTAAQLCDIIQAWLEAGDCHYGDFEKGLRDILQKEGRFE